MFWTEELYEKAYDLVTEKYPIVIPSVNRPKPIIIDKIFCDFDEKYNWPVILILRKSQVEDYKKNLTNPYVQIVSFEDELINDIGKVRAVLLEHMFKNGHKRIFMSDDDMYSIGFNTKTEAKNGSYVAKKPKYDINSARLFAMWQLASEQAFDKHGAIFAAMAPRFSSWPFDTLDEASSMKIISQGSPIIAVNIEKIYSENLVYESDKIVGFCDLDFNIKVFDSGNTNVVFPWLYFDYPEDHMSVENYEWFSSLEERLEKSYNVLLEKHKDKNFIKVHQKPISYIKNSKAITQVSIDVRQVRKNLGLTKSYKVNVYDEIRKQYNF